VVWLVGLWRAISLELLFSGAMLATLSENWSDTSRMLLLGPGEHEVACGVKGSPV
jgi:hypothetical protein